MIPLRFPPGMVPVKSPHGLWTTLEEFTQVFCYVLSLLHKTILRMSQSDPAPVLTFE